MDNSELLIDFSSPVSKHSCQTPLIPIPKVDPIKESVSPILSNPFDTVAKLASPSKDPFESVFKSAFHNPGEVKKSSSSDSKQECDVSKISHEEPVPAIDVADSESQQNTIKDPSLGEGKKQTCNEDDQITDEPGDHAVLSADFSSDDGLRTFIANRVKNCIQKALNSSVTGRISKSNDSVWSAKDGNDTKFTYNRRSLSFVMPPNTDLKCDKLNKSYSDSIGDGKCFLSNCIQLNNVVNKYQNSSFLSSVPDELSIIEDTVFDMPEEEQIFHEANKIARIISNSCCKIADEDNDDDWLSGRPQWLDAPGSDDEEDRLLRDPALNVRVSLVTSLNRSSGDVNASTLSDSQALSAYKARRNRSLGSDQIGATMQEESKINRNSLKSIGSMSSLPSVPAILVKPDDNIRLKKKGGVDTKRGPMKAVMPIQSMTKDTLAVTGNVKISRDTSPIRRPNPSSFQVTPQKNPESSEIRPVASSTPTRREVAPISAQLNTPIDNTHLRHSVGSTEQVKGQRSRPSDGDLGSRLRSINSGSSIPTVASTGRAPKAIPVLRSVARSTSSLPKHSPQIKPVLSSSIGSDKKPKGLKPSYNPRALSDLKTSSPRRGMVKSAVTTISGLVSGKGKKRSVGDKENKFPV